MKSIQTVYVPETVAAFESYNSRLDALAAERTAIQQEREKIRQDALKEGEKTTVLRKRFAVCMDRAMDVDRKELALLAELPKLEEMASADWKLEADKHKAEEEARKDVLRKHAAELGMNAPQQHRLLLEDRSRQKSEQLFKAAREFAIQPNVITEEDTARVNELRKIIEAAFK